MKTINCLKKAAPIILLLYIVWNVVPAQADEQEGKNYILGAGDVIEISVWDQNDLFRKVEIAQDGTFTYPFVGKVLAAGKSVAELEKSLTDQLSDGYLVEPQLSIHVAEYMNQKVFLLGEVNRPGSYSIKRSIHLLELVSEAGGLTANSGSKCVIVRKSLAQSTPNKSLAVKQNKNKNISIELNLNELMSGNRNFDAAYIHPGDTIYIKEADYFYVIGEVGAPGKFKWVEGLNVLQAVSLAGGETGRAALNRVSIVRKVKGSEQESQAQLSDLILPQDIIKVPESYF